MECGAAGVKKPGGKYRKFHTLRATILDLNARETGNGYIIHDHLRQIYSITILKNRNSASFRFLPI
jgi:hypothetical protein